MSTNTIIQQGRFTATGSDVFIPLRGGVSWMNVYNVSQMDGTATTAVGVQYYWQLGFPSPAMISYDISNAAAASNLIGYIEGNGFTLVDTSAAVAGTIHATVTAVSSASIPVVSNSGTNGLVAGNMVRLFNVVGAKQLGGIDFTVGYNTLTSGTFSLDYMSQIVAGTTGSWMQVAYDPIFYPRRRTITKITQATQAVVTLSVTHGYKVGQLVRMIIPSQFGMTQMNGLQATIVAVNTTTTTGNSITLNVDSTAFTAFAFPLTAVYPFSPAEVVPMGEDTAEANLLGVNALSDATINTAQIGMILEGGANLPGGAASEVLYWTAGTAFSVDNQ